jgi:outer membrane protein OmpA-like peptidoglycan-associated protein
MAAVRPPRILVAFALGIGLELALGSLGCATAPKPPPGPVPALSSDTIARYLEAQKKELAGIKDAKVVRREELLLVTFPSEDLFESGLPRLSEDAPQRLGPLAQTLRRYPESNVVVRGYTDSLGNAKANLRLSEERATSVSGYLSSAGVDASRLRALGFGEQSPVASNDTDEGREKNRRVEIEIVPVQDSLREGGAAH